MPKLRASVAGRMAPLVFAAAMASFPLAVQASEGGQAGNVCPWAKDLHVDVGGHPLVLPQTVFAGKASQVNIDGFEVLPDLNQLKVVIIGPYSDMWEAALTLIDGGKRCTTYYVGEPILVSAPQAPAPQKKR